MTEEPDLVLQGRHTRRHTARSNSESAVGRDLTGQGTLTPHDGGFLYRSGLYLYPYLLHHSSFADL